MQFENRDGYFSVSINLNELQKLKNFATNSAKFADRISTSLAIRLLSDTKESGDTFNVLAEIDLLERKERSCTKKETQFKNFPLYPFWHKHFASPRHIVRNLGLQWEIGLEGDTPKLDKMIASVSKKFGNHPDLWPNVLAHNFSIEGYKFRSLERSLTGDWIIFAKHAGRNYYLDLAQHEEAGSRSDKLKEKLELGCKSEFPFLFE